jgi:hypothetical protein
VKKNAPKLGDSHFVAATKAFDPSRHNCTQLPCAAGRCAGAGRKPLRRQYQAITIAAAGHGATQAPQPVQALLSISGSGGPPIRGLKRIAPTPH